MPFLSGLILIFLICFAASTAGAVCGIGGGVIIKPVLDALGLMTVAQASFLSGVTVLCMSTYSVVTSTLKDHQPLETRSIVPMGIGAAAGGLIGKILFKQLNSQAGPVGFIQSLCLMLLLVGTLIYSLKEDKITTRHIDKPSVSALIGFGLGFFSSFLGIGGGPFNLVVLSYCFSMNTKTAARHSLFVILISQTASLLYSLASGSVPEFAPATLLVMAAGGIAGGIVGRAVNRKIADETVHRLFIGLTVVIIAICGYNLFRMG